MTPTLYILAFVAWLALSVALGAVVGKIIHYHAGD